MLNPPKIKYKNGVHQLNPQNLFDSKDFSDVEELFEVSMRECKRYTDKREKISSFMFFMELEIGNWITLEYLFELLNYLEVTFEDVVEYRNEEKKKFSWRYMKMRFEWLDDLLEENSK